MTDNDREKICYCFNYTRKDIEADLKAHGRSRIMERIVREKQFGNCQCGILNPKGK